MNRFFKKGYKKSTAVCCLIVSGIIFAVASLVDRDVKRDRLIEASTVYDGCEIEPTRIRCADFTFIDFNFLERFDKDAKCVIADDPTLSYCRIGGKNYKIMDN